MEYNYETKNLDEVFEEFPQFKGKVERMPFYRFVKKFKREELQDLIDDANFYKDKVTPQKRQQFMEIAKARATYHFCWGWDNIFNACFSYGVPNESIVKLVGFMLSEKMDPFSIENQNVTADYLYRIGKANSPVEKYSDEEALQDISVTQGDYDKEAMEDIDPYDDYHYY